MNTNMEMPKCNNGWDKIFSQSDKVENKKVSFRNRYGITLVGDLYFPEKQRKQ